MSKHHETKINESALKIVTRKKIRTYTSKKIAPKQIIFHLFLYASFSLKQILNLTQFLLTYWIVFIAVYIHFHLSVIYILRILKFIQCLYALFRKTSKILVGFNILFSRFSASKCFYVLFFMKHSYLLTTENNSWR